VRDKDIDTINSKGFHICSTLAQGRETKMRKHITIAVALIIVLALVKAPVSEAGLYKVDPVHSEIEFSVVHMVIAKVRGAFQEYSATFEVDDQNLLTNVKATIITKSLNTRIAKRDNHLRSEDFFYAEKYPTITFKSDKVTRHEDGSYTVLGKITIRGVTKTIALKGGISGPIKDPSGNMRMGFSAEGMINRKDFGLNWNEIIETGGFIVGDEVKILLEGEGILKSGQ